MYSHKYLFQFHFFLPFPLRLVSGNLFRTIILSLFNQKKKNVTEREKRHHKNAKKKNVHSPLTFRHHTALLLRWNGTGARLNKAFGKVLQRCGKRDRKTPWSGSKWPVKAAVEFSTSITGAKDICMYSHTRIYLHPLVYTHLHIHTRTNTPPTDLHYAFAVSTCRFWAGYTALKYFGLR